MALRELVNLLCVRFYFLIAILLLDSFQATATREGSFKSSKTLTSGLCASLVAVHGYKCQELQVTTQDGYILGIQRIPDGRSGNPGTNIRPPVILQHGVLVDGASWLLNQPEQNLPHILADNGFDVWIINGRGTKYSNTHVSLSTYDPRYWEWTWDELAAYDLPAVINFVNNQTGQKAHYIGHSQGTLTALISFSEGRLVDKLKSATLLTPIAYLDQMTTPLGQVAARDFVDLTFKFFHVPVFDPIGEPVRLFLDFVCILPGVNCYDLMAALTGFNCCLNQASVDLLLQNEPQPTSVDNMAHFAQSVRTGVVAKYDYGYDGNIQRYQQATPPIYNLSNIPRDFPLFLTYGGQDALSDVNDVQRLLNNDLKSHDVDKITVQFIKEYAHLDFIMGINANNVVYGEVINFLRRW